MTNTREYPRAGSEKSVHVPVPAMSSTRITRTRQTQNPRGFGNPIFYSYSILLAMI